MFQQLETGKATSSKSGGELHVGVDTLPPLPKHAGDRNRTSPFAFTGNKFEFRAVGSSQSIAGPLVVLNTIVAESLDFIATKLEKATGGDAGKLNAAVQTGGERDRQGAQGDHLQRQQLRAEWHAEAEKRGLPNLRNTVSALPTLVKKESDRAVREVRRAQRARGQKPLRNLHGAVLQGHQQRGRLCPVDGQDDDPAGGLSLSGGAGRVSPPSLKAIGKNPAPGHAGNADRPWLPSWRTRSASWRRRINHKGGHDLAAEAKHYHSDVVPAMLGGARDRRPAGEIVADDLWPLPTYREILFIK